MRKEKKIMRVDKSLAKEIENVAGVYGVSNLEASRIIAKKIKTKKDADFYHL